LIYASKKIKNEFRKDLLLWYKINKRNFPWRYSNDPYKILVSEVLLQKTNVSKVLPVFNHFIQKYPTINELSVAKQAEVEKIIKDLGLIYRAERLISIAKQFAVDYQSKVPSQKDHLLKLRGLGNYVSSAVTCFAFNKRVAIVDTNIVRLIERVFDFKSSKNRPRDDNAVWKFAEALLPIQKVKDYNYALLDFSALICTAGNPRHEICPLKKICKYYKKNAPKAFRPLAIDLFAGAGGLSLGFEQAGFDIVYMVEEDKYAAETYKRNRARRFVTVDTRDIKIISPKDILRSLGLKKGEIDFVIGGPPCQGFSMSNMKTRNLGNPQNHLIYKFVEFVKEINPKWFLMENVGGLSTFQDGYVKNHIISGFENLGYMTRCVILNAVNFGVPQNRNRIFFVGNRLGYSCDFIEQMKNIKVEQTVTVCDAISDLPRLKNGNTEDILEYRQNNSNLSEYQKLLRKGMNGKVANNLVSKHTSLAIERFKHIKQGENLISLAKKKPSLVANYKNVDNCHHWVYLRLPWSKPSVTLNNYRKNMLIHPMQKRGLSVREAARLQSFPDSYVFYGHLGFQQQQVANAVPPHLAQYLAKQILRI
jgi:DNA (cytosine-5)-methyltransferase 1